jgi:pyruvate formate lyase activating enzyme
MSQSLVGSRYEIHVAKKGAEENRKAHDYYAIHPGDVEEVREDDDVTGYVHSWEVGSTVDGPGLRFVGFLTGCLLRCQYCHNPDTWHKYNGRPVTVARAMQQISKYAQVLKISKGGITLRRRAAIAAGIRDSDLPPMQGARDAYLHRHLGPSRCEVHRQRTDGY